MATYFWVGGYTGFTGTNSGWTGQYQGTTQQRWIGPQNQSSIIGDMYYAPYAWNLPQNWRVRLSATGSNQFFYQVPTTTPAGGDVVFFGGTGPTLNQANISCLYGGMSGDGFTASGITGWANGTTANRYGDVTITIAENYFPVFSPAGFRTGEIGIGPTGAINQIDTNQCEPLNIRTNSFFVADTRALGLGTRYAVNNLSSSLYPSFATANVNFDPDNPNDATPFGSAVGLIKGNWWAVNHSVGSLFLSGSTTAWLTANNKISQLSTDNTATIENAYISPKFCQFGVNIWGSSGSPLNELTIRGWKGQSTGSSFVTLGDFVNQMPTITRLNLFEGELTEIIISPVPVYGPAPIVKMGSIQIDYLQGEGASLMVHPNASVHDYPILRDGYLRRGTIDMSHPEIFKWQQFILGYSPSDPGIKIGGPDVKVVSYEGQSLVSTPGSITG